MLPPCLLLYALAWPFGRRHAFTRIFLGAVGRRLGLRVRIEGRPLPRGVLFVSNHLSWFDILALGGAVETAFVAKGEIRGWPLVGWLARVGGTIFVDRERRSQVGEQANALTEALATGRPALLFGEGTTSDGRGVLPFRPALFAAVAGGAIPLQPVSLDYGAATPEVAWVDEEPFFANAGRLLMRPGPLAVTIRFLDPIDPVARDRKPLAATARAAIAASVGKPDPV